jgi:energy-coupling factor transporter ATP-binding protein EcfA2
MGAPPGNYRLGPFQIASEIPFPELTPAEGEPNVWIRLGTAPEAIENVVANETMWWASKTEYLQRVPKVATFHVSQGRTIVVEPAPGSLPGDIRAYLLAPMFTSLCFQNGMYALHASSVQIGDGVVAFLGHSGAGKSTLAASLERLGFPVVSDDFCLLGPFLSNDGGPVVIPVAPAVKLWPSALDHLGTGPEGLSKVWSREDKYRLRLREASERLPLRELFFLEWSAGGEELPAVERLAGPAAIARLMEMTHFDYVIKPAGRMGDSFLLSARIMRSVPAYTLRRPRDFKRMGEVIGWLEDHLRGLDNSPGRKLSAATAG